jgi:hypothetical protein
MLYKLYNWFTSCCSNPETAVKKNHVECLRSFAPEIREMSVVMKQNLLNAAAFCSERKRNSLIYLVEEMGLKFHWFCFRKRSVFPYYQKYNEDLLCYVLDNWDFDTSSKDNICSYIFGARCMYSWEDLRKILLVMQKRGFLQQSFFDKYKERYIGEVPMTAVCARFLVEECGFNLRDFIPSIEYLTTHNIYSEKIETLEDIEWLLSYVTCPLVYEDIGPLSLVSYLCDMAKESLSTKIFVPYPNIQKLVFSKEHGAEKCKCNNKEPCPFARLTKTI